MELTELTLVDGPELRRRVPMARAVAALAEALRGGLDPERDVPRAAVEVPAGQLLLMPSAGARHVGVKVAGVAPGNPARGLPRIVASYLLLDAATLRPVALLDGSALTALRTPAVSAVAVDRLAEPGAGRLVVFGTGPQAWGHIEALRVVRPLTWVGVVGRTPERAAELVRRCREVGLAAEAVPAGAVADADLVACCTSAREPLFDGRAVPAHATVVAMGSHEPTAREVDTALVRRATVVVEARAAALREAGDLCVPLAAGEVTEAVIAGNLAELVRGEVPLAPDRPRLFKGVGMSWQDLTVATEAVG
ncbi:ornithine cyclodeaminase family protein [Streptomyces sp. 3MP-14]|uniref:Ornithine cyclodeaminase family protein n=1 Tax=Streptomyces mimosae TaxID=2586635 RepID=A0A5N5ZUS6_9ACTN|nr:MULTISPECIES: ornithine cyclodeaminase family protein [Streptomyces]KAB8159539.1 ornithine cyclodeaminase family protein [Streptomyces mimosae]KAB8172817.1 ornithine cyclodeaminase family protein [Streptomyces sp. 3MP-14]